MNGVGVYDHILIATDGSPPAEVAVDRGIELGVTVDAEVSAVSVVDTMAYGVADVRSGVAQSELEDMAETALETVESRGREVGMSVSTAVLTGRPAATVCEYATDHDVDLIVVGTHGREGVERVLLGSVAERITRTAPCSVLVVREGTED